MIRGLALALAALAGCNCSGEREAKPKIEPIERAQPARAPTAARPRPTTPPPTAHPRHVEPVQQVPLLSLDEGKQAMPPLGARRLEEPALAPNGSQVLFTYCVDAAGGLADAAGDVTGRLAAAGWTSTPPKGADDPSPNARAAIIATKGDLRLRFTMQATTVDGCDGTAGQFHTQALMGRVAPPPTTP